MNRLAIYNKQVKFLDNKENCFLFKMVDGKSIVRVPEEILIIVLQYKRQYKNIALQV